MYFASQVTAPKGAKGTYPAIMIAECAKHSMKPVCDHAKSCDASGLFIGQAGSLSTPADRENAQKVPLGFAAISSSWKGACGYRAGNARLANPSPSPVFRYRML